MSRRRGLAGALGIVLAVALLARDLPARALVVEDPPGPTDAIVVMSGDPDYERTTTAVRLLRDQPGAILVLTGGDPGPGDAAETLRARALALGVPAARIRLETASHSTREAVVALAPLLAEIGARSVTLVTSPYHQRRARWAARRAWPGVVIRSRAASPSFWAPQGWWRDGRSRRIVASEYAKLVYYGLRGWLWPDRPSS